MYNYQYIHNMFIRSIDNMFIAPLKNYTLQQKHGFSFLLQPLRFSNIIQRQVRSGYSKPNGTALMTNIPWQAGVMKKYLLKVEGGFEIGGLSFNSFTNKRTEGFEFQLIQWGCLYKRS